MRTLLLLVLLSAAGFGQDSLKSKPTAVLMETVVPGLGLAYTGSTEDALVSLGGTILLAELWSRARNRGEDVTVYAAMVVIFRVGMVFNAADRVDKYNLLISRRSVTLSIRL